jgi:hypothetical protein
MFGFLVCESVNEDILVYKRSVLDAEYLTKGQEVIFELDWTKNQFSRPVAERVRIKKSYIDVDGFAVVEAPPCRDAGWPEERDEAAAEKAPPPASGSKLMQPGTRAVLRGHPVSAWNGKLGTVVSHDAAQMVYIIRFDAGNAVPVRDEFVASAVAD